MAEVARLLALHSDGRISDKALDAALKSLSAPAPVQPRPVPRPRPRPRAQPAPAPRQRPVPKPRRPRQESPAAKQAREAEELINELYDALLQKQRQQKEEFIDRMLEESRRKFHVEDEEKFGFFPVPEKLVVQQIDPTKFPQHVRGIEQAIELKLPDLNLLTEEVNKVVTAFYKKETAGGPIKPAMTGMFDAIRKVAEGGSVKIERMTFYVHGYEKNTLKNLVLTEAEAESYVKTTLEFLSSEQDERARSRGSGWTVVRIRLFVAALKYTGVGARAWGELPPVLSAKKAVINVKNTDERCFGWALLSALHPADKDAQRISKYGQYWSKYDWTGIQFPVDPRKAKTATALEAFEKRNNVCFTILGMVDEQCETFNPLYQTSNLDEPNPVILLLVETNNGPHYVWVKNLSKLLGKGKEGQQHASFTCTNCWKYFRTSDKLVEHQRMCRRNAPTKVILPSPDESAVFFDATKRGFKAIEVPFVIYADAECFLKDGQHIPASFALHLVSRFPTVLASRTVLIRGADPAGRFLQTLKDMEDDLKKALSHNEPMRITAAQEAAFKAATVCHICEKELGKERVRDHCHYSGEYRGAAHESCNLEYTLVKGHSRAKVPVYFHNGKGYDFHLLLPEMSRIWTKTEPTGIAQTFEKLVNVRLGIFEFRDSAAHLLGSLEKLAGGLKEFPHMTRVLVQHYGA